MAQLSLDVPDEDVKELQGRVRYGVTVASQVREAIREYLAHGTRRDREDEQVQSAHGA